MLNIRTLKLIAASYLVKTALLGAAWMLVPDLPERVMNKARETWAQVTGAPAR